MGTVNLGQVAALIQSVTFETLPEGATPTVRNDGTKANAKLVFGLPDFMTTAKVKEVVETKVKEAVETKVKEAVTAKEVSLLTKIDKKFIEQYQNGYIQWPGMPSPLEDTTLHFEEYSWYEVNYDGNFFRAKGRNAKAFSSKKLTIEQIRNGDYIFQDDEQGDAIRRLFTKITAVMSFYKDIQGQEYQPPWNMDFGWGGTGQEKLWGVNIRRDVENPGETAEENRSRNLTFTIWVLVKDE